MTGGAEEKEVHPLVPHPKKVSLGPSLVEIEWSDGHASRYRNTSLREACPCAVCKGEPPAIGTSPSIVLTAAAPADVKAVSHTAVGRYAVSFVWSDGHSTGIYPHDYLLEICECDACSASARRGG